MLYIVQDMRQTLEVRDIHLVDYTEKLYYLFVIGQVKNNGYKDAKGTVSMTGMVNAAPPMKHQICLI